MSQPVSEVAGRDPRLDVLRGIALVTIFINHVPRNVYEQWTSRNFGFSDAAEGFVLMSGIAAGLAYSGAFGRLPFMDAALRVWRRARKLYLVHLLAIALALAVLAVGYFGFETADLARRTNYLRFAEQPFMASIGAITLGYQIAYFNILPLYVVLLLATPFFILIGRRSILAMVGVSMLIWILAGSFRLNLPNFPGQGGWFFNPVAWQFLFVIGLAGGMSMRQGRSLVPWNPWLFAAAASYLVFSYLWMHFRMGGLPGGRYVPFFIGSFDKAYLPLPRLLHVLALAYLLVNMSWVFTACRSRFAAPLEMLGRNGLPVFATGSVIAIVLQVYREIVPTGVLVDTFLLAGGLLLQYWVAVLASNAGPVKVSAPAQKQPATRSRPARKVGRAPPVDA